MSTPCLMSGHHLLEQLEQLPYFAKLDEGQVGDVAAWTRQTRDKAAAKWGLVGMTDVASFATAAPGSRREDDTVAKRNRGGRQHHSAKVRNC